MRAGSDPWPSARDIQALGEERDRLLAAGRSADAVRICRSWIEQANSVGQAEGHRCLASVLLRSAKDSGGSEVVSTPAQRLATGGTAAEPRFSTVEAGRAIDQLDLAAAANPADLSIHQQRVALSLASGAYDRAVKSLDMSLKAAAPASADPWLPYVERFPRTASNQAAVFAGMVAEKYPDSAAAHVAYAGWLDVIGKEGDAKQHLARALELEPKNPMAHWRLAEVLEQFNDAEAARAHYKASVAVNGELAEERRSEYERRQLAGGE